MTCRSHRPAAVAARQRYRTDAVTYLDPLGADVEDADHASDEAPDGFEVDAADAPGSIDQQHNVGLGCGLAPRGCVETAIKWRNEPQEPSYR